MGRRTITSGGCVLCSFIAFQRSHRNAGGGALQLLFNVLRGGPAMGRWTVTSGVGLRCRVSLSCTLSSVQVPVWPAML